MSGANLGIVTATTSSFRWKCFTTAHGLLTHFVRTQPGRLGPPGFLLSTNAPIGVLPAADDLFPEQVSFWDAQGTV